VSFKIVPAVIYLKENPPLINNLGITKFIMTNKYDMFQYISSDPIINARYNYAEMKCANDIWTKREKPIWFNLLGNLINSRKNKLKLQIIEKVKNKLPILAQNNGWTVYRYHSFLRIAYDCLFQGNWKIKAKFMNKYNPSKSLINQLTFPQLFYINEIIDSFSNSENLKELNIKSLKYRNKQKYKNILPKNEWLNSNPYKPTKYIYN